MRRLLLLALALAAAPATAATREFTVIGFDRLQVNGPYDVTVRTGLAPSALATGTTEGLERISVAVEGSTLIVQPDNAGWGGYPGAPTGRVTVAVTVPGLSSAVLAGSGRLAIDRVRGPALDLAVGGAGAIAVGQVTVDRLGLMMTGSGNAALAGHAGDARIVVRGAGNIVADGLSIRHADITAFGGGTITLTATESAKVTAAGTGDVTVLGKADCTVTSTGAGNVSCGKPTQQ
jgi:hypothetical protein